MGSLFSDALSFSGSIKRLVSGFFRINRYQTEVNEILDRLPQHNFHVHNVDKELFRIQHQANQFITLRKSSSDILVFNQVFLDQEYKTLVELVHENNGADRIKVIVDAGANIGLSSVYLAEAFKGARVCSIEPSEQNLSILKLNTQTDTRIQPLHAALWFENGSLALQHDFRDKLEWSIRTVPVADQKANAVQALTLASIKSKVGLSSIDILKIDIEGAEGKLFESAAFLEELKQIPFLAMEVHEEAADKISVINTLQKLGYSLKIKGETLFGVNKGRL